MGLGSVWQYLCGRCVSANAEMISIAVVWSLYCLSVFSRDDCNACHFVLDRDGTRRRTTKIKRLRESISTPGVIFLKFLKQNFSKLSNGNSWWYPLCKPSGPPCRSLLLRPLTHHHTKEFNSAMGAYKQVLSGNVTPLINLISRTSVSGKVRTVISSTRL